MVRPTECASPPMPPSAIVYLRDPFPFPFCITKRVLFQGHVEGADQFRAVIRIGCIALDPSIRIGGNLVEEELKSFEHLADGRRVEEVAVVFEPANDAVVSLSGEERQIESRLF